MLELDADEYFEHSLEVSWAEDRPERRRRWSLQVGEKMIGCEC